LDDNTDAKLRATKASITVLPDFSQRESFWNPLPTSMRAHPLISSLFAVLACACPRSRDTTSDAPALPVALASVAPSTTSPESAPTADAGAPAASSASSPHSAPLVCAAVTTKAPPSPSSRWTSFASGGTDALWAVSVSASDEVWLVGENGVVVRTRDHAKTFERCSFDSNETLTAVWATGDEAWILGTSSVFHVDGQGAVSTLGVTLAPHFDASGSRASVFGASTTDIWIANGVGGASTDALLHTTDGGRTFSRAFAPDVAKGECLGETSGSPSDLWTACNFGLRRSTDGGATWKQAWSAESEVGTHVAVGPDAVWAASSQSPELARSTDHGATWTAERLGRGVRGVSRVCSAGGGWAWAVADRLWVRPGAPPWAPELPAGLRVAIGGRPPGDLWAVGDHGLVLRRR